MNTEVRWTWHDIKEELPEEGREVLCATLIDNDSEPNRQYSVIDSMYYLHKGSIFMVEHDRSLKVSYPGQRRETAEERLLKAIFGEDDDLQEIEETGWYTFDTINEKGLLKFRKINEGNAGITHWCYPIGPNGYEIAWKAKRFE